MKSQFKIKCNSLNYRSKYIPSISNNIILIQRYVLDHEYIARRWQNLSHRKSEECFVERCGPSSKSNEAELYQIKSIPENPMKRSSVFQGLLDSIILIILWQTKIIIYEMPPLNIFCCISVTVYN